MPADRSIDDLDARLIALLTHSPRIGILEAARRLGVARGTAQARLDRMQQRGVIRGFGPDVDAGAMGYTVLAFATLEIAQGRGHDVEAHLAQIPEVLEAHTITGPGDLLVRLAARDNEHLQQVIDCVLEVHGIRRTSTVIALSTPVAYRILPLVERAASP
jgi:DNA-binding Lrp family transcriptional regulator